MNPQDLGNVQSRGDAQVPGYPQAVDGPSPEQRASNAKGAALAREKLAQAKADAQRRGQLPRTEPRKKKGGPKRDSGDPMLFGAAIQDLLAARGWEEPVAIGGVFGRWREIVGAELGLHTRPEAFEDGEVIVSADSTAWATQVRLLAPALVRRLNEELGDGTVTAVKVRGPNLAPPRQAGHIRVKGSRGPGDTFG